ITQVRFPPGTTLWKAGDPATWMLLLASGSVRCRLPTRPPGPPSSTLPLTPAAVAPPSPDARLEFVVCAGNPVGALESLGELPRWHDAVTETTVVALQGN